MAEDASLDDFLGTGEDDPDDTGAADPDADEDAVDEAATADADATTAETDVEAATTDRTGDDAAEPTEDGQSVTPATTTYAWSDEGTTCEACGAPAERRWHQDGALVCPACKEW